MHQHTGEVRRWDALTDEEKASGDWIKLPVPDPDGYPPMVRRQSLIEKLFKQEPSESDYVNFERVFGAESKRGTFDANGKPR